MQEELGQGRTLSADVVHTSPGRKAVWPAVMLALVGETDIHVLSWLGM